MTKRSKSTKKDEGDEHLRRLLGAGAPRLPVVMEPEP